MNKWQQGLVLASLAGIGSAALAGDIEVMTQNQYLGAGLAPIIAAGTADPFDPVAFNDAVITALQTVAGNLPQERFEALADEILKRRPHLVGLQEVFRYSCAGPGCADPSIAGAFVDHLQGTLDALGGAYVAEARVSNLDLVLPFQSQTGPGLLSVIDRDVILARSDIADDVSSANFNLLCPNPARASDDGCNYETVGTVNLPVGATRIERGYVGVNASIAGTDYLFVNTHLEEREPDGTFLSRFVQARQAAELIDFVSTQVPPSDELLVVGDINSGPDDEVAVIAPGVTLYPPYVQFVAAGFVDVWTMRPGVANGKGAPLVGLTCCQDEALDNHQSALYERIDVIFSWNTPKKVKQARLLGESISDKTAAPPFGLWPSDHAAVAALLEF